MAKNKGNKKTRQAKKMERTSNTGSSSESSDNMDQDQKNTSTLEMEISDRVDSLRMLEDIRKEISKHIKTLRKMINQPVEITQFGDNIPTINGTVTLIQEEPEHEEWVELSPAQVNGKMTLSHIINIAMIQDINPLEKPKYSTEELANLMTEKGIERNKNDFKMTSRPTSPFKKGHSRAASRTASRATSRAASRATSYDSEDSNISQQRKRQLPIIYTPPSEHGDPDTKPTRQGKLAQNAFQLKDLFTSLPSTEKKKEEKKNNLSLSFEILPEPEKSKQPENPGMLKNWIKQAKKSLRKEKQRASNCNNLADYHTALQQACDKLQISTNIEDIKDIKIQIGTNLNDDKVLTQIWQQINQMASTRLPELKLIQTDEDMPKMPDHTKWQGPLMTTLQQSVDLLYLEALHKEAWQKNTTGLGLQDWMDQKGITRLIIQQGLHLDYPHIWIHHQQTSERAASFLRYQWEEQFFINKIAYEPWYEYVGRHMTIPENGTWIEAAPLQTMPKGTREQNTLQTAPGKTPKQTQGDTFGESQTQEKNQQEEVLHTPNPMQQAMMEEEEEINNFSQSLNWDYNVIDSPEQDNLLLKPWTANQDWYNYIRRSSTQTPPMNDESVQERRLIWANRKMAKGEKDSMSIKKEDFMDGGQYSHLFIPKYPCVPTQIMIDHGLTTDRTSPNVYNLWRQCYSMRQAAAHQVDKLDNAHKVDPEYQEIPWIKLLLDTQTTKTFEFDKLDIIQYNNAWRKYGNADINYLESREFYDIFIRPMERMMARNMPLSDNLYRACLSKDATEDFIIILIRMAGFAEAPVRLSSTQIIEEMSRVRHLHTRDYMRHNGRNESPIHPISQVQLKESENWTYIPVSAEETCRQTFSQNIQEIMKNENLDQQIETLHRSILQDSAIHEKTSYRKEMHCKAYKEANTEAEKWEFRNRNTITACKLIKLERSSATMWKDLESKTERKAQERFAKEIATQAVSKAQDANRTSLSDLLNYIQLWATVLISKRMELKNIRNCLHALEENNIPSFEPSTITLKKSLIDRKYKTILDISEFDLKIQTAMVFYEARLPEATTREATEYQHFISSFKQTKDTERLRNTGTYEPLPTTPIKRKTAPRHGERTRFGSNSTTGIENQNWKLQEVVHPTRPKLQRQEAIIESAQDLSPNRAENSSTDLWSDMVDQQEQEEQASKGARISKGIRDLMFMGEQRRNPFRKDNEIKPKWTSTPHKKWTGTPWDAPNWSKRYASIQEITYETDLMNPDEKLPIVDKPQHKQFHTNGMSINTTLDIKMMVDKDPMTIGIREQSSHRHNRRETTQTLYIPCEAWTDLTEAMIKIEKKKLPAAIKDYSKTHGDNIYSSPIATRSPNGTWNCLITVEIQKEQNGTERIIHITCYDHISRSTQHIRFPWIHLPIFNRYANMINKELFTYTKGKFGMRP